MFAASYLSLSRHNIYYIRYPIPKSLHPQGKVTDVRLSLKTRCPREALHISRHLVYLAESFIQQTRVRRNMEYSQIREAVQSHFQERLDRIKQRLDKKGEMPKDTKESCENSLHFTKEAIKGNDLCELYTDQTVLPVAEKMGLSIQIDTLDYNTFRTEYMKASRDLYQSILDYNKGFDAYQYQDRSQNTAPSNYQNTASKSLKELITIYMDEKIRTGEWRPQTAKGFKSKFDFLQEYMGAEATALIAKDKAHEIYTSLLKLPKQSRSNPKYKSLSIPELLETEHTDCMSAKNAQTYIQAYSAFFDWVVSLDYCANNAFKTLIKKSVKGKDKNAFSTDQIHLMLEQLQSKRPNKDYGLVLQNRPPYPLAYGFFKACSGF